jgi:outer membrane autotransporter protein
MAAMPMKTERIKVTTHFPNKLLGILAAFITALLTFSVLPKAWSADLFWTGNTANPAVGGSGPWVTPEPYGTISWSSSSTSFVGANWANGSVANFVGTTSGTATLGSAITTAGVNFGAVANAFTIATNQNTLTVQGAITNTSGNAQMITNNGGHATSSGLLIREGLTVFSGTAITGNITITNEGGTNEPFSLFNAPGGSTSFNGTSSAGSATIISNAGAGGALGGTTNFLGSSDGGTARAITNGNASFDISGLTTAGMRIGSIEGSGNYFLGSKTLSVGSNNSSTTVSGVIQDGGSSGGAGGSLTKIGTGTLTLTGTNTYSGGTNLNGGILAVNSDTNLGTVTGALSFSGGALEALVTGGGITSTRAITLNAGGGTFLADAGTASTLSGAITGIGAWIKTGPGTLTLSGANTYTGATTVNAGVLQAGSVDAFSARSAFTVNTGAMLDLNGFNNAVGSLSGSGLVQNTGGAGALSNATLSVGGDNTSTTFSGTLQDGVRSLALTKVGTGTLTLTGANTYTGGTTINTGALQLGNGGTTGSITGNVTDNGILAFDRSNVLTFGGVISGTGRVQQNGTGTTVLVADNTYTGATTVNAGNLIVDGSIASAQTLVNSGGLLGGRGSLGGSLVNSGIVSPGDSPGTLTVKGNYTQNPAGTLRIEIAGLAPSQHDLLAVNGHASLAGTLQLIRLGGFNLHVGDQVTFLTANGGVSGTFGTIQNDFATIVKAQVVYLPNGVVLEGAQGSFVQAACTPNTVAVAQALDSAVSDPRASGLIGFLNNEPLSRLCSDFALIAPEGVASIFNIGVSLANVQTANLNRRMDDIRAGSTGFSAAGFTLNGSTPSSSGGLAGVSGPEGKSGPSVMTPTPENRWGVWVTGIGEFTNVDSTNNAAGYYLQTGGVTLGVDYRVCSNFAIGLTAGYAHTGANLANGGSLEVNGGTLGLYATVFGGGFYLDAAVTGGPSGYDSHRTALLGSANGSTDGGDLNVLVAAGYEWKKGGLSIGPTANFQFTYVGFSGFTESGSLAPLKFPDQNSESERTAFGMKASYDWKVGHVIIKPEISIAWQHEYGDQAYSIVSSFANGAGNSFTVNSPTVGRDSLLIGAGAAVLLSERISIYAYYDGELGRTNYQSNNVSAGVRVTF